MRAFGMPTAWPQRRTGTSRSVFIFFSNRMGCAGSLTVSALLTLAIVLMMRACNHA
jgi:hypothetical protein